MKLVRYNADRTGIRALLGSDLVRLRLIEHAAPIAIAAQAAYDAHPPETGRFSVDLESHRGDAASPRARVAVIARHPAALAYERRYRILGAAMGGRSLRVPSRATAARRSIRARIGQTRAKARRIRLANRRRR